MEKSEVLLEDFFFCQQAFFSFYFSDFISSLCFLFGQNSVGDKNPVIFEQEMTIRAQPSVKSYGEGEDFSYKM